MAILAGDALLTHAFEIAASYPAHRKLAARKVRAIRLLARAAGVTGMIGGQVLDLEAEGRSFSYGTLLRIHRGKTGALISAAVQIGGIMAGGSPEDVRSLPLDAKADANHFFTDAGVPTTFLYTSFYWENFIFFGSGPKKGPDGTYTLTLPIGDKKMPSIAVEDLGKAAYGIFKAGKTYIAPSAAAWAKRFNSLFGQKLNLILDELNLALVA